MFHNIRELVAARTMETCNLGATGFDRESESMGCGPSYSDSLNGVKTLTANTYQEPMALVA